MRPVYRLLITLLLAISLPVQGVAAAWQNCCGSTAQGTAEAREHKDHTHHEELIPMPVGSPDATTGHSSSPVHGCTHSASCCSLALPVALPAAVLPAVARAPWLSFQPPAPDSHTPLTADPPPRRLRA